MGRAARLRVGLWCGLVVWERRWRQVGEGMSGRAAAEGAHDEQVDHQDVAADDVGDGKEAQEPCGGGGGRVTATTKV